MMMMVELMIALWLQHEPGYLHFHGERTAVVSTKAVLLLILFNFGSWISGDQPAPHACQAIDPAALLEPSVCGRSCSIVLACVVRAASLHRHGIPACEAPCYLMLWATFHNVGAYKGLENMMKLHGKSYWILFQLYGRRMGTGYLWEWWLSHASSALASPGW